MGLADKVRIRRLELELTQDELAKRMGYSSRSSINKIEKGRNCRQSVIVRLAEALNTTPAYLMGWEDEAKETKGVKIPVLGDVAAGIPIDAIEDVIGWEEIPTYMAASGTFFGLRIKGRSMMPSICDGDIVIVRQQQDAESGEIVIAKINGDTACCKKLIKNKGGIVLQSFNPEYEPLYFNKTDMEAIPVTIIGKVMELRRKFE